jgi:hypothetical protein
MRSTLPLSAVLILVLARSLAAQTVFVEGGVFLGIERLSHTSTQPPNASLVDLSGTTVGGRVGVGTFLSPQWSAQIELALPNLLKTTTTIQPPILQPLSSLVTVVGQPALVVAPVSITYQVQRDYRAPSAAVLVGYHTARRHHVEVGYLGGLMFLDERQHTITQTSYMRLGAGVSIPTMRAETTVSNYRAAAATGLDVDIALGSHLALVPQVRTDVFAGSLSVRPAVGVRWNF